MEMENWNVCRDVFVKRKNSIQGHFVLFDSYWINLWQILIINKPNKA